MRWRRSDPLLRLIAAERLLREAAAAFRARVDHDPGDSAQMRAEARLGARVYQLALEVWVRSAHTAGIPLSDLGGAPKNNPELRELWILGGIPSARLSEFIQFVQRRCLTVADNRFNMNPLGPKWEASS
ncbi:MAG: hypothetical protein WCB18_07140 [Thermoplasmata archaeon]